MKVCKWCGDTIIHDSRYDNWESVTTGNPECGEGTHQPSEEKES